jgi:hypothetical protein
MRTVIQVAKDHLTPLVLVEMAAMGVAMLAGWTLIAAAVMGVHMTHMGIVVLRRSLLRRHPSGV